MSDKTDRLAAGDQGNLRAERPTPSHIDAAARRLWHAWHDGQMPDVHEFLQGEGELSPAQMVAVFRIDLQERWRRGERPNLENYLQPYPALANDPETYALVNDELLLRQNQGEMVALDSYYRRFPHFAERIWRQIQGSENSSASDVTMRPADQSGQIITAEIDGSATAIRRGERAADEPGDHWLNLDSGTEWQAGPRGAPSSTHGPRSSSTKLFQGTKYKIIRELGRGGMGVVYQAQDTNLKRTVALKMVLAADYADAETLLRFKAEAEAVAQLDHPNIVQIYEVGELDGKPFFALEYLEGGSLRERTQGKPQPAKPSAALIQQLADAIHYAHQHGVIHRDLKPINILFTKETADEPDQGAPEPAGLLGVRHLRPKITDFGLAKFDANKAGIDGEGAAQGLTRSGDILGTPSFMAPEQALAKPELIGPQTDIYALGAILYELLTGRPPFEGITPLDTIMQVGNMEPVPPRRVQPSVPRDLEIICLKCLQKEPKKRYASGKSLAADLQRFRDGKPILAKPSSWRERAWKWTRRNPAIAALLLGMVAVTAAGFFGITWQWLEAAGARDQAREAQHKEAEERRQADVAREAAETALHFSRIVLAQREYDANRVAAADELLEKCRPRPDGPDLRSWDWYYLKRLCRSELVGIRARGGWTWNLTFSPDGRYLATASSTLYTTPAQSPGEVALWDARTGGLLGVFWQDTDGMLTHVAISPNGRYLATASARGKARVFDVKQGKELLSVDCLTYEAFGQPAAGPSFFSPDSELVFFRTPEGLRQINIATGEAKVLPNADFIAFGPNGQRTVHYTNFATRVEDGTGRELRSFQAVGLPMAVSPDGRRLLVTNEGHCILWNLATGQMRPPLAVLSVLGAAFSPDGLYLATAHEDRVVRVWNAATGDLVREYHGHGIPVRCVAFSPDGARLASGDQDGVIKIWDITADPGRDRLGASGQGSPIVGAFAFDADSRHMFVFDSNLQEWDLSSGLQSSYHLLDFTRHLDFPRADFAFSGDGRRFIGPANDRQVLKVIDTANCKELRVLRGHRVPVRCVAANSDGHWVASAGFATTKVGDELRLAASELKVWDAVTGVERWSLSGLAPCFSLALSRDGTRLAGAGADGRLHLWNGETGRELLTLPSHPGPVFGLAFSPDGTRLASAGFADYTVRVWNLENGREVFPMRKGPRSLASVAFSPDGKRIAAVGYDSVVQLWDAMSGNEVLALHGTSNLRPADMAFTSRVVFSPDGSRMASLNWEGTITIWETGDVTAADQARRQKEADGRTYSWHEKQLVESRDNPFAAKFHLDHLRSVEPPAPGARWQRGQFLAGLGLWQEAEQDYVQLAADPATLSIRTAFEYAYLLRQVKGDEPYRQFCRRVWNRLAKSNDDVERLNMSHMFIIGPDAIGDPQAVVKLAKWRKNEVPGDGYGAYVLAAAHYRAGQYGDAAQALDGLPKDKPRGPFDVLSWLVMAMAEERLGKTEGRLYYDLAEQWWAAEQQKNSAKKFALLPPDWPWPHALELQFLRREAAEIFGKPNK